MAKKTKNNTLTVKQSNNLGTDLTNIMSGLQALRHHANTLMIAKHAGQIMGYYALKQISFLKQSLIWQKFILTA